MNKKETTNPKELKNQNYEAKKMNTSSNLKKKKDKELPWWVELLFVQIGLPDKLLIKILKAKKTSKEFIKNEKKAIIIFLFVITTLAYFYPVIKHAKNKLDCESIAKNYIIKNKNIIGINNRELKMISTNFCYGGGEIYEIKNLEEKKNYFQKLLNERELLLELLIEELLILKKKYNVIRKTKIIKNINQHEELEMLNNQILEDFINKKTKLFIDNRLYLKKMILSNYKKSFEVVNKIIDNKNIQKFICNIEKNIKLIGITNTGKVFNIDWESSINKDYKLDNKILGNIHPNEIINFHLNYLL